MADEERSAQMDAHHFISTAIARGEKEGLSVLSGVARTVFVISEVEAECDVNGVDNVVDRIEGGDWTAVSKAFSEVGAVEIADCFRKIEEKLPHRDPDLLARVNRLVTSRNGYGYDTIAEYVRRAEQGG